MTKADSFRLLSFNSDIRHLNDENYDKKRECFLYCSGVLFFYSFFHIFVNVYLQERVRDKSGFLFVFAV